MPTVVEANELKHRASETGSQNEPFIFLNLSFRHLSQQQKANTVWKVMLIADNMCKYLNITGFVQYS